MKIAITGGIGSGKSYVCRELERHGIEVYDCDDQAKRLMRSNLDLQIALRKLVGEEVSRAVLAKFILKSDANKQAVNEVVHPFVARDFEESGYDWLESAILFDSGFDKRTHFDYVVCVTAPVSVRLERIMQRDGISREKAQAWIDAVMPQEELVARSDFEIVNDGKREVAQQVVELLDKLRK